MARKFAAGDRAGQLCDNFLTRGTFNIPSMCAQGAETVVSSDHARSTTHIMEGHVMKRIPVILVSAVVLAAGPALSQTEKGSWEFSLAGNFGSQSASSEYTTGGRTYSNESDATGYVGLDVRVGAYILDAFSVEPEIYFLAVEDSPPAYNIGANLGYTFSILESPVKPFVIAGYGIGNGTPIMQRLLGRSSDEFDIPVLRLGGGVKFFVSRYVALKAEFRYERYSHEETQTYYSISSTSRSIVNFHNVLFGVSVFLPGGE